MNDNEPSNQFLYYRISIHRKGRRNSLRLTRHILYIRKTEKEVFCASKSWRVVTTFWDNIVILLIGMKERK